MYRTALASSSRAFFASSARSFHTTPVAARTMTEKVSDVASDVNLKVGKSLAGAIEKGEQATQATKETLSGSSIKEVADNVDKKTGQGLASAIEKGEQATQVTKEAFGAASAKSKETANIAGQKANQAAAGAREGKEDFKKDVYGCRAGSGQIQKLKRRPTRASHVQR